MQLYISLKEEKKPSEENSIEEDISKRKCQTFVDSDSEEVLKKSTPYYSSVKDYCTVDEYFERVTPIYNNVLTGKTLLKHIQQPKMQPQINHYDC